MIPSKEEVLAKQEELEKQYPIIKKRVNILGRKVLLSLIVVVITFGSMGGFLIYYYAYLVPTIDCSKPMQYSWMYADYDTKCFGYGLVEPIKSQNNSSK
ncbi:MAG TPA: hypothetical protein VEU72_02900 [Nitrosopumilaceae archaeon]|nr:hypothetical protein [Nitrosopumilaceae archaeon]